jgi:Fe-S oxidoreductase
MVSKHGLPDTADTVFFIGCTSNYRETSIRDAAISIMKKAGIDFTVVDEYCCGSPLLRTGQTESVSELARHNLAEFVAAGCKRVVTACAGCYRTLSREYPDILDSFDFDIVHLSQLIKELIEEGHLSIDAELTGHFTYHDPCHLGRHGGVYDEPRDVMRFLRLDVSEMSLNRANAWCCGAGGGVRSAFRDMAQSTARERIRQAEIIGADHIITCCPFCVNNLTSSSDGDVDISDLAEIVDHMSVANPRQRARES